MRNHVIDRTDRIVQCRESAVRQAAAAVEDFAHDLVQRFGDSDAVPRFGHLGAAAQGMDGAIHRLRQFVRCGLAGALAQVFADLGQMARGLLAVNIMQHGIHRGRRRDRGLRGRGGHHERDRASAILRRHGHGALIRLAAVGVGKCARHQCFDRRRTLPPRFQLFHQLRQGCDRSTQQSHHSRRARQGLVDDPIQQILNRPAELGDRPGADHAAAALQSMETASHPGQ